VAADPGDDAGDEPPRLRMIGAAEAERVQIGDRPRAHGEDVAQDAADAGRRTLIGLDEGGMIVALDLEDRGVTIADIDDTGILAGAADDARASGGEPLQPLLGRFVRAVLAPHHREDAELGEIGYAAEDALGALELGRSQS